MNAYTSPLFPMIWKGMPLFWLGCGFVRLVEGPERQAFNANEAAMSLRNQFILGVLWSSAPSRIFFRNGKKHMTLLESLWKMVVAALITDFLFYWVHRALHEVSWLWFMHRQHHRLRARHTVWGGLDESADEMLTIYAYVSAPFLVLDVTPKFFAAYVGAGAIQTAIMHGTSAGGWVIPPWPLVGAKVHHDHHVHLRHNYSGVFILWDVLMGTNYEGRKTNQVMDEKMDGQVPTLEGDDESES